MAIAYKPFKSNFVRKSSSPKAIVCVGCVLIISTFVILLNLPNQVVVELESVVLDKIDVKSSVANDYENNRFARHRQSSQLIRELAKDKDVSYLNAYKSNETAEIRTIIREMMKLAWTSYKTYAWGFNELKPLEKTIHAAGIFGQGRHMGATIVDSLDTLYIMGLAEEYDSGRQWVIENILGKDTFLTTGEVSVFEVNIRMVGGLLSMHSLTNDKIFLDAAHKIATKLLPAFQFNTGLPHSLLNLKAKTVRNYAWAAGHASILAEVGTFSLEFQYLSDHTGDKKFEKLVNQIYETIDNSTKNGTMPNNYINTKTAQWQGNFFSLGALGDSYYEYLLKYGLYMRENDRTINTYLNSMKIVRQHLVKVSKKGLTYVGEIQNRKFLKKMGHLACFSGGLFALTSMKVFLNQTEKSEYDRLAKEITRTCHESYARTPTKLGPEYFHFDIENHLDATANQSSEMYYILRPEVVESYFYLWRMTKDQIYRDWAWEAVRALEFQCRTKTGYVGLSNVYDLDSPKDDVQQSYFMAETLKYLYLIFSDDDVIPLDKFVFNTEAHPLLIRSPKFSIEY